MDMFFLIDRWEIVFKISHKFTNFIWEEYISYNNEEIIHDAFSQIKSDKISYFDGKTKFNS